ncbi:MAG: tRNA (adenosine(37)-N6)-threonylcarbamoyltransferase complex ATPase subunit type 1 TsaE, partial [Desulfobacterales bacterium CG23_combo_of_CG06-09_8_20_14_all_51_8]
TRSPEETLNLGELIGLSITGKFTIALTGDLGAGKTVFVQGLARGLDVNRDDPVTSPT